MQHTSDPTPNQVYMHFGSEAAWSLQWYSACDSVWLAEAFGEVCCCHLCPVSGCPLQGVFVDQVHAASTPLRCATNAQLAVLHRISPPHKIARLICCLASVKITKSVRNGTGSGHSWSNERVVDGWILSDTGCLSDSHVIKPKPYVCKRRHGGFILRKFLQGLNNKQNCVDRLACPQLLRTELLFVGKPLVL